jgi:hypothetical protein
MITHDDVVDKLGVDKLTALGKAFCELDTIAAGHRVTSREVAHEDDGRGALHDRRLEDLARMRYRGVDGAVRDDINSVPSTSTG